MIAELAARTGQPMTVIARTYSLPELVLVLFQRGRLAAADLLAATQSRALAKDVSTSDPLQSYRNFTDSLVQVISPTPLRKARRTEITALFAGLGIRPQS